MKTLTTWSKRVLGYILVLTLLAGMLLSDGLLSTASAANEIISSVTFKLNGQDISGGSVDVKDGDQLEVKINISAAEVGDTCTVELPDVFLNLNESTILEDNAELLGDVEISFNGRSLTLTFKNETLAAAFVFVAHLSFEESQIDVPKQITIGGEQVITIVPKGDGSSGDGYVGPLWPPTPVPDGDMDALKYGYTNITESHFVEDTVVNRAYFYTLLMNTGQYKKEYAGTLSDTLPTGMQLFIPNAPNCGTTDYAQSNKSFYLLFAESIFEKDTDGSFYGDISKFGSGKAQEYINLVNAVEQSRGRSSSYAASDLDMKIEVPQYFADALTNGEDTLVTYNGNISLGYKINPSAGAGEAKITLVVIDRGHPAGYYAPGSEPASWASATRAIPLYDAGPDYNTTIYWESPYVESIAQYAGKAPSSGVVAAYKGKTTEGNWDIYSWDYTVQSQVLFTLTVKHNTVTGVDAFEASANVTESSLLYGKCLGVCPFIYFDQSKWSVPSDGKITFKNTAVYNGSEKEFTSGYEYTFASGGTVISGRTKAVDKENISLDGGDNELHYSLQFKKTGDVSIEPGELRALDVLDGNVKLVKGSIKISMEDGAGWTDVTTTTADAYSEALGNGVNIKVSYNEAGHRIMIENPGETSFAGKIKIDFDVTVNDSAGYGTKIINYFGDTVETYIDHKIAINKVDGDEELITGNAAGFTIQYTIDSDYTAAALSSLTDPDGSTIGELTTGSSGIAETLYRLEEDVFYLKITETSEPSGYEGISGPIWMKAERNTVTNKMVYTLLDAPDGVALDVTNGLVELTVANEPAAFTPATVTLHAKKEANVTFAAGTFRFALLGSDGKVLQLATNKTDGSVDFTALTYNAEGVHNYTIVECGLASDTPWTVGEEPPASVPSGKNGWSFDTTVHRVTVTVTETGSALDAAVEYLDISGSQDIPVFSNTYTPGTADTTISGSKTVTGIASTTEEFTFSMVQTDVNGTPLSGAQPVETDRVGAGAFSFSLTGLTPGTYYYKVTEKAGDKAYWDYDDASFMVTVVVTESGGEASADVSYPQGGIVFSNTYTPGKANATISGNKTVTGTASTTEEFTFSMVQTDDSGTPLSGAQPVETDRVGAGTFSFGLTDLEPGVYYYKITEKAGGKTYWTYDDSFYIVKVTVTDNGAGVAAAQVDYQQNDVVFSNEYTAKPTSLNLEALKLTEGRDLTANQFTFGVFEGKTPVASGTNDKNGVVRFSTISYNETGTHTYTIRETSTDGSGWTTDKKEYTITVDVTDDGEGALAARITSSPQDIRFTNRYSVKNTSIVLSARKTAQGAALQNGQFNFAVYEGNNQVSVGTNTAGGVVNFGAIVYTKAGSHTYTVRETSAGGNGWVTDTNVYTVTVNVVDNGDGTLTATAQYPSGGITFVNRYTPPTDPGGGLTLRIRKQLFDENGNVVGTGKKLVVRLYDSVKNMIHYVVLDANGGEVVIEGLDSGTTYYLQEDDGSYTILGYEIVGIGSAESKAIGFRVPQLAEGQSRTLEIIVKNQATPDELINIPDEDPPLIVVTPPGDVPMIDIPNEEPPLGLPTTGDMFSIGLVITVMAAAVGIGLGCALTRKKSKKSKKSKDKY